MSGMCRGKGVIMKYFKQYWVFILLGIIYLSICILSLIWQHNENELEYRPGETYFLNLSNVNLDLVGDNITVTYQYDNVKFIKTDKYYWQE